MAALSSMPRIGGELSLKSLTFGSLFCMKMNKRLSAFRPQTPVIRFLSALAMVFPTLRNDLYCVGWGVKLYSIQSNPHTADHPGLYAINASDLIVRPGDIRCHYFSPEHGYMITSSLRLVPHYHFILPC